MATARADRGHKWKRNLLRERIILSLILVISLLMFTVVLTIRYFIHNNEKPNTVSEKGLKEISPTLRNDILSKSTQPNEMTLISRAEWLARPPVDELDPLHTPVLYVIIWHTVTKSCSDQDSCAYQARCIQAFHIQNRHWRDIGYNFLVGGDGKVYEGRGWTSEGNQTRSYNHKGGHTYHYNNQSIGIAFIGTFSSQKPPSWQMDACKLLIATGIKEGYIDEDYKLLGARQLAATEAPGQALYEELQTWPHWSATPP